MTNTNTNTNTNTKTLTPIPCILYSSNNQIKHPQPLELEQIPETPLYIQENLEASRFARMVNVFAFWDKCGLATEVANCIPFNGLLDNIPDYINNTKVGDITEYTKLLIEEQKERISSNTLLAFTKKDFLSILEKCNMIDEKDFLSSCNEKRSNYMKEQNEVERLQREEKEAEAKRKYYKNRSDMVKQAIDDIYNKKQVFETEIDMGCYLDDTNLIKEIFKYYDIWNDIPLKTRGWMKNIHSLKPLYDHEGNYIKLSYDFYTKNEKGNRVVKSKTFDKYLSLLEEAVEGIPLF